MMINDSFVPVSATASEFLLSFLQPDPSPVTEKLLYRSNHAEPEIKAQGWVDNNNWNKQVLKIDDSQIFKREIIMRSQGLACWYARTIIPQSCYALEPEFFGRLARERLTPLVFNEPKVHRTSCFFYPVDERCMEFHWAKKFIPDLKAPVWARLSEFEFRKQGFFYLSEIFLPDLMRFDT